MTKASEMGSGRPQGSLNGGIYCRHAVRTGLLARGNLI